jgi:hypothetical protein
VHGLLRGALLTAAGLMLLTAAAASGEPYTPTPTITWTGGGDGTSWTDAANWDEARVPAAIDHVQIPDVAATAEVVLADVEARVASLSHDEPLRLRHATLALPVGGRVQTSAPLVLQAATLAEAVVRTVDGGVVRIASAALHWPAPSTLEAITIDGRAEADSVVHIVGDLGVEGELRVDSNAEILFLSGGSLTGTADVHLAGGVIAAAPGAALLLDEAVTIDGWGTLGCAPSCHADDAPDIELLGTLRASQPGLTMRLAGRHARLAGSAAIDGGSLLLDGDWTNAGVLKVTDGTLRLGGRFTPADLGTLVRDGGRVVIQGDIDGSGGTLGLDATTGSFEMASGRLRDLTLEIGDPAELVIVDDPNAIHRVMPTFDDVTVRGRVRVDSGSAATTLSLRNGLRLDGELTVAFRSTVDVPESLTIGGRGALVLDGGTVQLVPAAELILSDDLSVRGFGVLGQCSGSCSDEPTRVLNRGTIEGVHDHFQPLTLTAERFVNEGLIRATAPARVRIWNIENRGLIEERGGEVTLVGTYSAADIGAVSRGSGSLILSGLLRGGGTLRIDEARGDVVVRNGRLEDVVVDTASGRLLQVDGSSGFNNVVLAGEGEVVVRPSPDDLGQLGHAALTVRDGLTITGRLTVESGARISLGGAPQTVGGTGTLVLRRTDPWTVPRLSVPGTATLAAPLQLEIDGVVDGTGELTTTAPIDVTGQAELGANPLHLRSPVHIGQDRHLRLRQSWSNGGVLEVAGGTLRMEGAYTSQGIGTVSRDGGRWVLAGELDNRGGVLRADASTGDLEVEARVTGGRLDGGEDGHLRVLGQQASIADAEITGRIEVPGRLGLVGTTTIKGEVVVPGGRVVLAGDLQLAGGTLLVQDGRIDVEAASTQQIGGEGELVLDAGYVGFLPGGGLHLGPAITMRGHGYLGACMLTCSGDNWFRNDGVVLAAADHSLRIGVGAVSNHGLMSARDGATLLLGGVVTNVGTIAVDTASRVDVPHRLDSSGTVRLHMTRSEPRTDVGIVVPDHGYGELGGTVDVAVASGFAPATCATFPIVQGPTRGEFAERTGDDRLADGRRLVLLRDARGHHLRIEGTQSCNETSPPAGDEPPPSGGQPTPDPTVPPPAEQPSTDPITTEPPATEPPTTEPPTTEPPATPAPTTEPPTTEPPATEPPRTPPSPDTPPDAAPEVLRHAGADRIETAAALSRANIAEATHVVIARADAYPDALAGGPLAAAFGGPILLSSADGLAAATAAEIHRLGARTAYILGGEAALSPQVEQDLRAAGLTRIIRLAGTDRFHTAALVAGQLPTTTAYLVEGVNADPNRGWPDAVAVSGLAARDGVPILLTAGDALPAGTREALARLQSRQITIVGGTSAVGESVAEEIRSLGLRVDRLAGATRYETSRLVADRSLAGGADASVLWLTAGERWPDALVTGPLAGRHGVQLLVPGSAGLAAAPPVAGYLALHAPALARVHLVGGSAVITAGVEEELNLLLAR